MNKKFKEKDSKKRTEGNSRAFEFSTTMYADSLEEATEDIAMEVSMTVEEVKRAFTVKEVTE